MNKAAAKAEVWVTFSSQTAYRNSGKLSRETFVNFVVLEPPAKVFSTKFGRAIPTYDLF